MARSIYRVFYASIASVALFGCASLPGDSDDDDVLAKEAASLIPKSERGITARTTINPELDHPAITRFLAFAEQIKQEAKFDSVIAEFFTEADVEKLNASEGWYRYPFTAAMIGLSYGECRKLNWSALGNSRAQINCQGPYLLRSFILGESIEAMHFQFTMKKSGDQWYLDRGGLAYTQTFGKPEVNTDIAELGFKFRHNLKAADAGSHQN